MWNHSSFRNQPFIHLTVLYNTQQGFPQKLATGKFHRLLSKSLLLTFYTIFHLSRYYCYLINIYSSAELEGKKWNFWASIVQIFLGEHAPDPPLKKGPYDPYIATATYFKRVCHPVQNYWNPCSAPAVTYIPWVSCLVHWRQVSEDHKMMKWLPNYLQNRKKLWKCYEQHERELCLHLKKCTMMH